MPAPPAGVGARRAAVLVALAIPALSMQIAVPGFETLSRDLPAVAANDRVQESFPGSPAPAVVVVEAWDVTAPEVTRAIDDLRERAVASGQAFEPVTVDVAPSRQVARVNVSLAGTGIGPECERALTVLREEVVPETLGQVSGVSAAISGATAGAKDFNDQMRDRAPLVFAFVLVLAFALLLVTFRSIVVPIKAIALNLLSLAAYGVLTLVFQNEGAESLLGFEGSSPGCRSSVRGALRPLDGRPHST